MKLEVVLGDLVKAACDAVIVNEFEGVTTPGGGTGAVDQAFSGRITQALQTSKTFTGKLGETLVLPTYGDLSAAYIVLVGLGKQADLNALALRRASAAAIRACRQLKVTTVASIIHGAGVGGWDPQVAMRLSAEGTILGNYQFTLRQTPKKTSEPLGSTIETLTFIEHHAEKFPAMQAGLAQGQAIATATNAIRDMVADSPNFVTPQAMADWAKGIAHPQITCRVLEQADLERHGMGAFLSVTQGSDTPPKLLHLTFTPKGTPRKKVALVGKGVTFDSGGLSLKPSSSMDWMKVDMAGAGAVLGVMQGLASLGEACDIEVHAIAPCCENMPSGHSNRPGDIVTAMNGKTIEITNTDAEGRLILADALTYCQREVNPDEIIDLATLTGACITALGKAASGIMGTSADLIAGIQAAGEKAGERYWELPLYDDYKEGLKSDFADYNNAGSKGQAGSSFGGIFLREFLDPQTRAWVHLDIAGPAYTDKDLPEVPKGATGVGVRTLLYYLLGW